MPYEWIKPKEMGSPRAELHLWPYRSLSRRGFVWVISAVCFGFALPLLGLLGHPSLWLFLPILLGTVGGLWFFIDRSYRDGEILEELKIWPDRITLTRDGPGGAHAEWEANPYWVTVEMHPKAGPVKNYITLKGNEREVEIGAFLSEGERPQLYTELVQTLRGVKSAQ